SRMPAGSRRQIALLSFFFFLTLNGWSQGAKIRPEQDMEESDRDRQSEMDNVRDREQWFRANRTIPGEHSAELLHRAYQQKQQLQGVQELLRPNSSSILGKAAQSSIPMPMASPGLTIFGAAWNPLGPSPMISDSTGAQDYGKVDGRLTSVAVDQGDATGNTVYIGAAFGGLWKSTTAAAADPNAVSWTQLLDQQPTLAVGAIAIQPGTLGNTAVVLVGTGEPNSSGDSYYGMGILRSTDGGNTWTNPSDPSTPLIKGADCLAGNTGCQESFVGLGFSSFAFNTTTPTQVVAAAAATNGALRNAESTNPASPSKRGIYYSATGGLDWKYATVSDSTGGPAITPASTSSVVYNKNLNAFFAAVRFHGFYRSNDGGQTWIRLGTQPGTGLLPSACPTITASPSVCPIYRGEIAVKGDGPDMYVIYVDANEVNQGIYLTKDGGNTWTTVTSTGTCKTGTPPQPCTIGTGNNQVKDSGIEETVASQSHLLVQGAYNLWLAAVPNGPDTDLMVGTRNIYKCTITSINPQFCANSTPTSFAWKNLTHVYECSPIAAPSHLHPDQHGFDFLASNPAIMYFGNDGGAYRSLSRANNDGTCNAQNNFENLNANLGSISEFVSFSQDRNDVNTILGGLQDNGSPAIAPNLASSPLWTAVNNGDGGYNEIDPNNSSIWYTTNTDVSLQQCTTAPNCTFATFGLPPNFTGPNIGSTQVSGDVSEFYMPFTLDPAQTANVVLGTCRIWRGPGSGGNTWSAANAISPMFDSHVPTATSCTDPANGGQTLIRALAVGGPAPNGPSQVIYAGLDGTGQAPGHVFVTFNADANPPTWSDITANISTTFPGNPNVHFGISDIWIDKIDSTGRTAYVTVQGFGVAHLYKTVNGGSSWADLTTGTLLPDAPANTVITDQDDSNKIYLGTDVGAFVSTDGGNSWQNFGSGLPNVPVTRLRQFESASAGAKRVRASTYGRGLWEINLGPDYVLSVPSIATTLEWTAPSTSAKFDGLLIPFNNYSSQVDLTCPTVLPNFTCTGGGSFTPTTPGVPFSITASAQKVGTYNFTLQATGHDIPPTNHLQALTLNVISQFNVSASPSSATVTKGNTASYTINLNATPDSTGSCGGTVALSCSAGLPQATTCTFSQPNPTLSGAVTPVTLTIGTRLSQVNAMNSTIPLQIYAAIFPVFGVVLMGIGGMSNLRRKKLLVLGLFVFGLTVFAVGCGGGAHSPPITTPPPTTGTPTGTFTITVAATSGSVQHSTQVTLAVQ
ncbi:MAG TPA: hypothetical protein VF493_21545, partial [Terriglobales bacterium]